MGLWVCQRCWFPPPSVWPRGSRGDTRGTLWGAGRGGALRIGAGLLWALLPFSIFLFFTSCNNLTTLEVKKIAGEAKAD